LELAELDKDSEVVLVQVDIQEATVALAAQE
jgi:hypothetical protein